MVAVFLDQFDSNCIQLRSGEELFQVFEIGAVTAHRILGESSEVRTFEFVTQLPERNALASPAYLEQPQRDLAFALFPNLDRKFLAGRLG
jgi:hypothetical protein